MLFWGSCSAAAAAGVCPGGLPVDGSASQQTIQQKLSQSSHKELTCQQGLPQHLGASH
jgi:hypothetical protein